jgi:CHAT domain-containing protein
MRSAWILLLVIRVCSGESPQEVLQKGLHFADLYNWHDALPYFVKARMLFEAVGDQPDALYARCGAIRADAGNAPIIEISYRLGTELDTNRILQSDKELRMFCLAVKGDIDGEIDTPAMRRDWQEVRDLARELGNAKWQYRAQGQLGFADFYSGDLSSAQRNVGAALIGATESKDIGAEIFYLSATANGYQSQGLNDQAIQFADRAIALAESTPDAGYPIVARRVRIEVLVHTGRVGTAISEVTTMLGHSEVNSDEEQTADLMITAAQLARAQNDLPGAIEYLEKALEHARTNTYSRMLPQIESDLSEVYRVSGRLSKAEEFARRAAESAQVAGYVFLVPRLLHELAQVQISEGRYLDADKTYDRAAAIQDTMIGNANSVLGKTALIKGSSDLYAKHFALIAERIHEPAKAFAVLEQVRGRVMTDVLVSGSTVSPESLETERTIAALRLKLMATSSDREIQQLRDAIFLAEQSRSIMPELSILKTNVQKTVPLSALQGNLSPSEVMLEYVIDDPTSYCLTITRSSSRIITLKGKAAISRDVNAFLSGAKAKHTVDLEARQLYQDLLESIPEARGKAHLVVIRDGPLHLVPFDALMDRTGHYLVESVVITYSPSATGFFLLRTSGQPKRATGNMLAIGGVPYDQSGLKTLAATRGYGDAGLSDLPSSQDEARAAVRAFSNRANTLLLGNRATETQFKRQASRHRIIHLAVHGMADPAHPERAALVLLSDPFNGEDGFLQASEIVQLSLRAELVVLSACDTAVGPLEGQEGIANLSKAFLLAGARTVVSTLWSLDDDTALYLMKVFYGQMAQGKDASEALAAAKRTMLKTFGRDKAVPYYWAGFTAEGFVPQPIVQ